MGERLELERQRYLIGLYMVAFLAMFVLSLLTPKYADDFAYSFSFATDTRIRSVFEVIPSMVAHRNLLNGRVIPHSLVQVFLMFPKGIFAFFNALNIVVVLMLSSLFLHTEKRNMNIATLVFGIFSVWVFSPAFAENYLWLDGSINYSWAIGILMLFLWPYYSDYMDLPGKRGRIVSGIHTAIAFLAGAWSENASLVFIILAACLMGITWKKSRIVKGRLLISLSFACVGYAFLMSAPATSGRSGQLFLGTMAGSMRTILSLTEKHLIVLFVIAASLLALSVLMHGDKKRILFALLLLLAGIASLFGFAFAAYFVERHFSCTVFMTVLACMVLMDELFFLKKSEWNAVLLGGMTIVFLLRFSIGSIDIIASKHAEREREQLIHDSVLEGERTVTITNYYTATKYALPFILDAPESWINMTVASYYGLKTVYGQDPVE